MTLAVDAERTQTGSGRNRPALCPQPPRITVLGGGTGTSAILSGLLALTPARNLSVLVPAWDSGGSSGRLTQANGMVPPGDARQAVAALAGAGVLAERLLSHRFGSEHEPGLAGHAVGNLLLAALTDICGGDAVRALGLLRRLFGVEGNVFPSAAVPLLLQAEMHDGRVVSGEANVGRSSGRIRRVRLCPGHASPTPEALATIGAADVIILGPGSLYTSVIPHILLDGVAEAIARSPAVKVYVCNVMTQSGETAGMSAADHVQALCDHAPGRCILDYAVIHAEPGRHCPESGVCPDLEAVREFCTPIAADVRSREHPAHHDGRRLACAVARMLTLASSTPPHCETPSSRTPSTN